MCKHRSLSTRPASEAVQPATARVLWYRDNFPGKTHGTPQAAAMSRWSLPLPQALTACHTLPYPRPEGARIAYSTSHLAPSCVGKKQMPERDLHAEARPNPKVNTRSCAKKKRKGNFSMQPRKHHIKTTKSICCFLHLWIHTEYFCEYTWIHNKSSQNWGGGFWGQL